MLLWKSIGNPKNSFILENKEGYILVLLKLCKEKNSLESKLANTLQKSKFDSIDGAVRTENLYPGTGIKSILERLLNKRNRLFFIQTDLYRSDSPLLNFYLNPSYLFFFNYLFYIFFILRILRACNGFPKVIHLGNFQRFFVSNSNWISKVWPLKLRHFQEHLKMFYHQVYLR
jgi:hypothetical protein